MIELTALTKQYGPFTAVDGIHLQVPAGELFGFLGPNGAGKTTTLRMIAGIPARAATGLAYAGGKFYYHAWPEVFLDRWVAVDPSFGQFPADAGHLRFVTGGLAEQAALLGIIGRVRIDVLASD